MELYYQNETLYVDIDTLLDEGNLSFLKNKIFKIVSDYDIDHIVILNRTKKALNRYYLKQFKDEYYDKFHGRISIR